TSRHPNRAGRSNTGHKLNSSTGCNHPRGHARTRNAWNKHRSDSGSVVASRSSPGSWLNSANNGCTGNAHNGACTSRTRHNDPDDLANPRARNHLSNPDAGDHATARNPGRSCALNNHAPHHDTLHYDAAARNHQQSFRSVAFAASTTCDQRRMRDTEGRTSSRRRTSAKIKRLVSGLGSSTSFPGVSRLSTQDQPLT
ncbi:MAG: hypothetical protein WBY53_14700, partial [Acidobacteriaceae bacterium]